MADPMHSERRSERRPWWFIGAGAVLILLVAQSIMSRLFGGIAQPVPTSACTSQPISASGDSDPPERPEVAFEPTDWAIAPVGWIYLGVVLLLILSTLMLIAAYPTALPDVERNLRIAPPGPRLQTDPQADLRNFRAEEERRLETYSWTDKERGIVRIPIQQAMKNLVTTGVPGFPKQQE